MTNGAEAARVDADGEPSTRPGSRTVAKVETILQYRPLGSARAFEDCFHLRDAAPPERRLAEMRRDIPDHEWRVVRRETTTTVVETIVEV